MLDTSHAVLIVIDAQAGFINDHTRPLLSVLDKLITQWNAQGLPTVFTRYINSPGSAFERILAWDRLQADHPDTGLAPELLHHAPRAAAVIDKPAYTYRTAEFEALITQNGWTDLVFAGIATDSCVLKSAADAFEAGRTPWVVTDACGSDAGPAVHDAALLVLRRLIGGRQLITTADIPALASAKERR